MTTAERQQIDASQYHIGPCDHRKTIDGECRCFSHSVACHPYTEENRRAHGNVSYIETCLVCGAERSVNENQGSHEYGTWGPSLASRKRDEREAARIADAKQAEGDFAAMAARRIKVERATETKLLLEIERGLQWVFIDDCFAAARQVDDGDGLVPLYRGILRAAGLWGRR